MDRKEHAGCRPPGTRPGVLQDIAEKDLKQADNDKAAGGAAQNGLSIPCRRYETGFSQDRLLNEQAYGQSRSAHGADFVHDGWIKDAADGLFDGGLGHLVELVHLLVGELDGLTPAAASSSLYPTRFSLNIRRWSVLAWAKARVTISCSSGVRR